MQHRLGIGSVAFDDACGIIGRMTSDIFGHNSNKMVYVGHLTHNSTHVDIE
jgi:hypothetical protein